MGNFLDATVNLPRVVSIYQESIPLQSLGIILRLAIYHFDWI